MDRDLLIKNLPAVQAYCKKLFIEKNEDRLKWKHASLEEKLDALDGLRELANVKVI
jgi:hypothetical protein